MMVVMAVKFIFSLIVRRLVQLLVLYRLGVMLLFLLVKSIHYFFSP